MQEEKQKRQRPLERQVRRVPKFGEWMRGVNASETNPHRDGMFVETITRTGRFNNGVWYRLTDGKGDFWEYPRESTIFIDA